MRSHPKTRNPIRQIKITTTRVSSLYVTSLPVLVAIGLAVVEIKFLI